ncbi:cupin-like domain-containing protein [Erythrobacter sp. NFXS35]|uniref:cupin-like domain-containing protein n=1 Tax=Erythrobacter sp. NFXS35 TaxID=2818436 RepID=UPI0032DE9CBB
MPPASTPCAAAQPDAVAIERGSAQDDAQVRSYFAAGPDHPVIFTDATAGWPALANWSMESFAREHGADLGFVQMGFYDWCGGRATSLGDFIAKLDQPVSSLSGFWIDSDYRPTPTPPADPESLWSFIWEGLTKHASMRNDVGQYPRGARDLFEGMEKSAYAALEKVTDNSYRTLYLSRKGTITPWHCDLHGTIGSLAQFEGRKRINLMPGYDSDDPQNEGFDPESPDYERFPQLAGRPIFQAIIEPGDMLIIPPHWWHHVRSLSHSITLSYNFVVPENASQFLASVQASEEGQAASPEHRRLIEVAFAPERLAEAAQW